MDFAKTIIDWYGKNKRDLPWRETSDPYFIWLSEVILQQTRVDQGTSYYLTFIREFPTVSKLAAASEKKVLKLWQGLGYYSRARNLHATAKYISSKLKGKFPDKHQDILKLKGVGPYTAAAISSIAFHLPHPVIDGNVYRVLSRVFGIRTPIDSTKGKKEFSELAHELLDKSKPSLYNQALMEFGSLFCKPKNPDCGECLLRSSCMAFSTKTVDELPIKEKSAKVRNRYFNYMLIRQKNAGKNEFILKKRTGKDIWKNMYDFPLIETKKELSEKKLLKTKEWQDLFGKTSLTIESVSPVFRHQLSHQQLFARFFEIRPKKPLPLQKDWILTSRREFHRYPVPRLIDLYMKKAIAAAGFVY